MDRYRSYNGRKNGSHRRRSGSTYSNNGKPSRRGIKLFICAGLFVIAAVMKLLFPSALAAVGDKLNSVVNYKAALTVLGQGISGEKKFTAALGEAFTYAFTGEAATEANQENPAQVSADITPAVNAASDSSAEGDDKAVGNTESDDVVAVFSEDDSAALNPPALSSDEPAEATDVEAAVSDSEGSALSNAVIAAFLESQEEYSDYAIPAGVTYDMPRISAAYVKPVDGEVSSPFGYRIHPTEKDVKFHYGVDIAAKKGTPISAFADGKVLAAGESTTLGKYVILSHGDVETEYAHCSSVSVASGQTVKKGDRIATVGGTGNATEICLHFELKVSGQYVNPEYYIQWI